MFMWHKVDGAQRYVVELGNSREFSHVLERVTVTDTVASALLFSTGAVLFQRGNMPYISKLSKLKEGLP